jgi:hypothetical protein
MYAKVGGDRTDTLDIVAMILVTPMGEIKACNIHTTGDELSEDIIAFGGRTHGADNLGSFIRQIELLYFLIRRLIGLDDCILADDAALNEVLFKGIVLSIFQRDTSDLRERFIGEEGLMRGHNDIGEGAQTRRDESMTRPERF